MDRARRACVRLRAPDIQSTGLINRAKENRKKVIKRNPTAPLLSDGRKLGKLSYKVDSEYELERLDTH